MCSSLIEISAGVESGDVTLANYFYNQITATPASTDKRQVSCTEEQCSQICVGK